MKKLKKNKFCNGFTLVETIIAITVIGMVVAAATQLTQSSLRLSRSGMNQFIAYHLAEEGVEIVRHLRDSNWLQNRAWRTGMNDGQYEISDSNDLLSGAKWLLQPVSDATGTEIVLSESEKFTRILKLETIPDGIMRVTARVGYEELGKPREVQISAEFTDWKKGPL